MNAPVRYLNQEFSFVKQILDVELEEILRFRKAVAMINEKL